MSNIAHAKFHVSQYEKGLTRSKDPFCVERLQYWKFLMLRGIQDIMRIHKANELVICCDSPSWRKKAFSYYKANRAKTRAKQGFDYKKFLEHIDMFMEEIRQTFNYTIVQVKYCEADDIIGILAKHINNHVIICSNDHDMKQLLKIPDVKLWSIQKKEFVVCDNPERYLIEHILLGDSGDGIPSVLNPDDTYIRDEMVYSKEFEGWFRKWAKFNPVATQDLEILENEHVDVIRLAIKNYEKEIKKPAKIKKRAIPCGAKKVEEILEYGVEKFIKKNKLISNYKRNKLLVQLDELMIPRKLWNAVIRQYDGIETKKFDMLKILQYINVNGWSTLENNLKSFKPKPFDQDLTDLF